MTAAGWQGAALPPGVRLRPATDDTVDFAEALYVASMQPLLERLDAWNDQVMLAHFRAGYAPEQVWVIELEHAAVGYLQLLDAQDALTILQLHLVPRARRLGIGSALIGAVLAHARARRKPVHLSVVRHNPAIALYRRFGFEVVQKDRLRLHMRWREVAPLAAVAVEGVPPVELADHGGRQRATRRPRGS